MQKQEPSYRYFKKREIENIKKAIFEYNNIPQLEHFDYQSHPFEVIYIIDSEYPKDIKIGIASDIHRRMLQLQYASGKIFKRIFVTNPSVDSKAIEKELHEYFKNHRRIGEWYYLEAEDVLEYLQNKYGYKGEKIENEI